MDGSIAVWEILLYLTEGVELAARISVALTNVEEMHALDGEHQQIGLDDRRDLSRHVRHLVVVRH